MGMESIDMDAKKNQPLITTADVGREAPKDRISETLSEGLKTLKEGDEALAAEYLAAFSTEELDKIDQTLNNIGETWVSLALAEDPAAVKNMIREGLNSGDLSAKKKELSAALV